MMATLSGGKSNTAKSQVIILSKVVLCSIVQYLEQLELLKLQQLSHFWYEQGVARAQHKFNLSPSSSLAFGRPAYFVSSDDPAQVFELVRQPGCDVYKMTQHYVAGQINDFAWRMVQLGASRVFLVGGYLEPRRFCELQHRHRHNDEEDGLRRGDGRSRMEAESEACFGIVERCPMRGERWLHSACGQNDRFIYVTGGA